MRGMAKRLDISIHALLAESDWAAITLREVLAYFYPRSPCGERHSAPRDERHQSIISIHALLAESDQNQHGAEQFPI